MNSKISIDYLLIIRGLASLGVLFAHSRAYDNNLLFYIENNFSDNYFKSIIKSIYPVGSGENYVIFFFVLSGYLMGKVFFNNRYTVDKNGVLKFYKNRFLRIAPLLYFNIILCLSFFIYSYPFPSDIIGNLLFINNIINPNGNTINPVTWSISYEMQYYLLAPFVFFLFSYIKSINTLILLIISIILLIFTKYWGMFVAGFFVNHILFYFKYNSKIKYFNELLIIFGFIGGNIIFFVLKNSGFNLLAEISIVFFAMITIYFLEGNNIKYEIGKIRHLILKLLTWLGILSYGVYLWHYPIIITNHEKIIKLVDMMEQKGIVLNNLEKILFSQSLEILMTFIFTIVISWISYHLIETKFKPSIKEVK